MFYLFYLSKRTLLILLILLSYLKLLTQPERCLRCHARQTQWFVGEVSIDGTSLSQLGW